MGGEATGRHSGGGEGSPPSPPERGGWLLVRQGTVAGGRDERGDVDASALGCGETLGEGRPVGVSGEARVDPVGQRRPLWGGRARFAEQPFDTSIEPALGTGVG